MKRRSSLIIYGWVFLVLGAFALLPNAVAQETRHPGRTLEVVLADPAHAGQLGWDAQQLDDAIAYAATLSSDAFLIVSQGETVAAFGDLAKVRPVHSVRKALLSALLGQHVGPGPNEVRLDATLADLGIDDHPVGLSDRQLTATVEHLLKNRSGINHPAAAEAGLTSDKNRRLGKDDNEPGTIWAYNNWDSNVLTTLFEMRTGRDVADAFVEGIARPAGMQDFGLDAVSYIEEPDLSQHRAASFALSARDLARFGRLYGEGGRGNGRQIVPAGWIDRVGADVSKTGRKGLWWGHSDLWWVPDPDFGLPDGTFWAWGLGNQALIVLPAWDTVIVHMSDTSEFLKRFLSARDGQSAEGALEELILSCRLPQQRSSEYCVEHRFITRRELETLISLVVDARL